jgi:hypothetical protein
LFGKNHQKWNGFATLGKEEERERKRGVKRRKSISRSQSSSGICNFIKQALKSGNRGLQFGFPAVVNLVAFI